MKKKSNKKKITQNIFTLNDKWYSVNEIDKILVDLKFVKNSKGVAYSNFPVAFDIETSSFYRVVGYTPKKHEEIKEKCACMYCFVFGINGKCVIGRTWDEFEYICKRVSEFYKLNENKRLIIWVHNLAYEFQFIRKRFNWLSVFSLSERTPVKALTDLGIEFRCTLQLSAYSLKNLGKNLVRYKVEKKVGDLDYSKIRTSSTQLTPKEYGYVLNDGLVVMAYIQEEIENNKNNITRIPLTKTSYVRKYCRKMCLYGNKSHHGDFESVKAYRSYQYIMKSLQIQSIEEYQQLKRAFQGGFTHANANYVGKTIEDVTSYDFTSSYPAVMIMEKFPMSSGRLVNIKDKEDLEKKLKCYCCVFDITLYDVKPITLYDHPISSSKCKNLIGSFIDNGRVISADKLSTTITEQDYFIYKKFYSWSKMEIKNFRIYRKEYLPKAFIESILKLYHDKTTLKGVIGEEVNYQRSKGDLNSCYGMTVTDICRDEVNYNDDETWTTSEVDYEESINKYNESKQRFLFYAWGIWVTAYARRNLFSGIYSCGNDYIYSDTDSIKIRHGEKHLDYINKYNEIVIKKLENAMNYHHLSMDLVMPKTIDGKTKILGVWEFDGHYKKFKTLGAKRYLVQRDDGSYSMTVSGLNKNNAMPYLEKESNKKHCTPFDLFKDGLDVPPTATGKNTHTYIDYEQKGLVIDYLGHEDSFHELSSVHMEQAEYHLSLEPNYVDYILGLKEIII